MTAEQVSETNPVFALLSDPATHGGAEVTRCETHAAVVFLAGDRAFKVKRAVQYPFLDYSTLEKRKSACQAELDVNRRFAPALYRRIVPITREPNGVLTLDGKGEAVEWAIEMKRFDERMTLDHIADRGEWRDEILAPLAAMVVGMHREANTADARAWLDSLVRFVKNNTQAFHAHPDMFSRQSVERLQELSLAALERLGPLLTERGRAGLVRRGHGDLHLGNIVLVDGRPLAFDALEFDPVIASGDVLYDFAFLLMDLVERGFSRAANQLLNLYFTEAGRDADCEGLAALPFFMSLRAAIRANVVAARLSFVTQERDDTVRLAKRYFDLALRQLAPAQASFVCVGGLSGTGKSELAKRLAPSLLPMPGALVLRSDAERKAMFGAKPNERLPPNAYRPEVSDEVYEALIDKATRTARSGYSVIVDATFSHPVERSAVKEKAGATSARFFGFFLRTDLQTRLERVSKRKGDISDADIAVAREQEKAATSANDWIMIDASGSPEDTLTHALHHLSGWGE